MFTPKDYKSLYCFMIVAVVLSVILSGCAFPVKPSASLIPTPETATCETEINRTAWIAPVEVTALGRRERADIQERLTKSIRDYIADANCFHDVRGISEQTANIGQTDVVLKFVFDRYKVQEGLHPEFIPLAVVTLTVWIWVGGDIYYDETDFSATLTVLDSSYQQITHVSAEHNQKEHYSYYDYGKKTPVRTGYLKPGQARAALVKELLDKALPALRGL